MERESKRTLRRRVNRSRNLLKTPAINSLISLPGVRFILNNSIAKFLPKEDGKTIGQVELLDGTIVDSDIAIVGIGATLNTEWLKETQIQLQSNGSLTTDRVRYYCRIKLYRILYRQRKKKILKVIPTLSVREIKRVRKNPR